MKSITKHSSTEYQIEPNIEIELFDDTWIVTTYDDFGDVDNEYAYDSFKSALDKSLSIGE